MCEWRSKLDAPAIIRFNAEMSASRVSCNKSTDSPLRDERQQQAKDHADAPDDPNKRHQPADNDSQPRCVCRFGGWRRRIGRHGC